MISLYHNTQLPYLERYGGKVVKEGTLSIYDYIDPITQDYKTGMREKIKHFLELQEKGHVDIDYHSSLSLKKERDEEKIALKEKSYALTKNLANANIPLANGILLDFLQTKDDRYLELFRIKGKVELPVEKIRSHIKQYMENPTYTTDQINSVYEKRDELLTSISNIQKECDTLIEYIKNNLSRLPKQEQEHYQNDMAIRSHPDAREKREKPDFNAIPFPYPYSTKKEVSELRKKIAPWYDELDQNLQSFLIDIDIFRSPAMAKSLALQFKNQGKDKTIIQQLRNS